MSRFTDAKVDVKDNGPGQRPTLTLKTPLVYEAFCLKSGIKFTAPEGSTSDGVSYPRWLPASIVKLIPVEEMKRSFFVHDVSRKIRGIPKFFTDYLFWECMGVEKTPMFWRIVCTLAVLPNFSRY